MPAHQHDKDLERIWRDYGAGRLTDDQAQAAARPSVAAELAGEGDTGEPPSEAFVEPARKVFGLGCPKAMDRNAKAWLMHLARALMRRTEKGRAYGVVTPKLQALLWGFHNAKSGLCFPS